MNRVMLAVAVGLGILGGCTTAGPFVTNISSDGNNHLHVEKCMVHMNGFMGTVSNTDCTSQEITLKSQ